MNEPKPVVKVNSRVTRVIILGLVAIAVAWDVWTLFSSTPNDTISETVWAAIAHSPIISFAAGFVCGHLFWQTSSIKFE
jgi:hypothetical protein